MESRRPYPDQYPRDVVCCIHDSIVRLRPRTLYIPYLQCSSIAIPWVTLRRVPVQVEIVSHLSPVPSMKTNH
jgi:hypothetical protein